MTRSSIMQMAVETRRLLDNNRINEAKQLFSEIRNQNEYNADPCLMPVAIDGETGNPVPAMNAVQGAIYASTVNRWQHYRQHIGSLLNAFPWAA
jgi:hypothetical protein